MRKPGNVIAPPCKNKHQFLFTYQGGNMSLVLYGRNTRCPGCLQMIVVLSLTKDTKRTR